VQHIWYKVKTHVILWKSIFIFSTFNQIWVAYSKILRMDKQRDREHNRCCPGTSCCTHTRNWISLSSQTFCLARHKPTYQPIRQVMVYVQIIWWFVLHYGFWIHGYTILIVVLSYGCLSYSLWRRWKQCWCASISSRCCQTCGTTGASCESLGWPISWQCGLMLLKGKQKSFHQITQRRA